MLGDEKLDLGMLGCSCVGMWDVEMSDAGMLVCWDFGMLAYWDDGMVVGWDIKC